ncbi:4-hydroxythreonine-4-phosphate dehydrogenase PdxA [Asticcacaulis sp. AND118]|uniref:4-hydroxythreonine-4-phosphate dehydrogenase PdxA n=1 Tax=Asticcacaulis sp. AND118 TaxID=2840468 RepID=UPI001CFFC5B0|nr:4-hydroxythreonine-4-phosphate dehydrogenase PdxA [Asticcacaulis sp. AND118]UDF02204.1 4-hydroxythreonine-4-phosphate dehydrogenase PdxA [Asticcacaulis sp. AND118]
MSPLVLSLGDPCGTGPELAHKAWAALRAHPPSAFAVLGDAALLESLGPIRRIGSPAEAAAAFADALPVLDRPLTAPAIPGQPDPVHAPHIIGWIREGVDFCLTGAARGLVTAPIAKSVLYATGFGFPGHTEYLGDLTAATPYTGTRGPVMMLTAPDAANDSALRVVLATIHIPLSEVKTRLSAGVIRTLAHVTHEALIRDFGVEKPRLVLAGLNPHAGEDGTIGREEVELLTPLVKALRSEGLDIAGPLPADTLFHEEARRTYDAALCLYHDQGLIPLKTLDFWGGVNITLGLPIVRTSPDHGTGFGIAGKGIARPDSLINAIRAAYDISEQRRK